MRRTPAFSERNRSDDAERPRAVRDNARPAPANVPETGSLLPNLDHRSLHGLTVSDSEHLARQRETAAKDRAPRGRAARALCPGAEAIGERRLTRTRSAGRGGNPEGGCHESADDESGYRHETHVPGILYSAAEICSTRVRSASIGVGSHSLPLTRGSRQGAPAISWSQAWPECPLAARVLALRDPGSPGRRDPMGGLGRQAALPIGERCSPCSNRSAADSPSFWTARQLAPQTERNRRGWGSSRP